MSTADIEPDAASAPPASMKSGGRRFGDALFNALSVGSGLLIFVTLAAVAIFLTLESLPAIIASREFSGSADFSLIEYSLPLVFGTVLASAIALVIAIPISLGIALFISHFAPRRLASALGYMIDLLAAVPSVVYGLWGMFLLEGAVLPVAEWIHFMSTLPAPLLYSKPPMMV